MKFKSIVFTSSLAICANLLAGPGGHVPPTNTGTAYHMTPKGRKVIVQTYQNAQGAQRKVLRTDAGLIRVKLKSPNGQVRTGYTNK